MTVESWGTGKPDYYVPTAPGISSVIEKDDTQEEWNVTEDYVISSQTYVTDEFYTVPSGYKLSLGGGFISADKSCINKIKITKNGETILGDFRFDITGDIKVSSLNSQYVNAGETITVSIYNNNTSEGKFTLTLTGVLEKI